MAQDAIPILMYHQINTRPARGAVMRGLVVSPASFARQMAMLRWLGYIGLSMSQLMPYLRGEKHGKVVGLTFDDGYVNNLDHAMPVLQQHGFSATCYVVSGQMGATNAWDHHKGIASEPLMQAAQTRAWVAGGQEIGAHTRSHVDLRTLSSVQAQQEIAGCKTELEDACGAPVGQFCYPYGLYHPEHVQLVQDAGYAAATTTARARARPSDPLLELPRVPVMGSVWLPQFWRKVNTGYEDRHRADY
jgi:peptidoglycan/xylan/chitin deacetylase (PgdA/CDA1 family)